jgi:hypothetical protein
LDGVALLAPVVVVDEHAFDFAHDLSDDVEADPYPDVAEGVLDHAGLVLLKLLFLLRLVLVGEDEEEDAQCDHEGVDDDFCYFWVGWGVRLQWWMPRLTI